MVPYRDDEYRKQRPTLQIPAAEVQERSTITSGCIPSLEAFSKLLEQQRLAIVQSVGYPNPNRSHFESMAIWQTARLDHDKAHPAGSPARSTGAPRPQGDAPGLHIHDAIPLPAVAHRRAVTSSRRSTGWSSSAVDSACPQVPVRSRRLDALDRLARQESGDAGLAAPVRRAVLARSPMPAVRGSSGCSRIRQPHKSSYPEFYSLARRLRLIAQLIKAGLSTSIYYTHLDGFDTHSGQLQQHAQLLRQLGVSLAAFLDDLEKSGESERVLVLVFSEFGRRLNENGSAGTDHGTAAPVFLLGRPVKSGLHGLYPDLAHLDDGDPRHSVDFRRVYATVLDRWLAVPHRQVLGSAFEPLPLLV